MAAPRHQASPDVKPSQPGHVEPLPDSQDVTFRAEQVRLLCAGIPAAASGNLLIAAITAEVLRNHVPSGVLLVWVAVFVTVQLARMALAVIRRSAKTGTGHARWLVWLRSGALFSGLSWGVLPVFLFPHDLPHQVFLPFVVAGVTGAAVAALSIDRISALLFIVPALVPLIARLFLEGGEIPAAMATMALLYLVYLVAAAQRGERAFRDTQALRQQADRQNAALREAQRLARLGSWSLDLASGRMECSDEAYAIYGRERAGFVPDLPTYYRELVHADDVERVKRLHQALCRRPGETHSLDHRVQRPDGSVCWMHVEGMAVADAQGRITRMVGTMQDITERKKVEQLKSEFVSTVSHELRTPLTSIRGALGLLAAGVADREPARARELLHIAEKNAERLVRLINDLLDIEKIASGRMTFDIRPEAIMPLVEQALDANRSYAEQFGVRFRLVGTLADGEVSVDAGRFQQVMANLLSNAAKFSPRGATVDVAVTSCEYGCRVSVRDQGPGIPDAFRGRLFERFSQADASDSRARGGTGLGLAIARELIERMGGRIGVDSVAGEGATFWVELRRHPDASYDTAAAVGANPLGSPVNG